MKLYRFLTDDDDASFCHKITEAINQGWDLYGPPQYAYNKADKKMRCGQAVIKTVHNQTYESSLKLSKQ